MHFATENEISGPRSLATDSNMLNWHSAHLDLDNKTTRSIRLRKRRDDIVINDSALGLASLPNHFLWINS